MKTIEEIRKDAVLVNEIIKLKKEKAELFEALKDLTEEFKEQEGASYSTGARLIEQATDIIKKEQERRADRDGCIKRPSPLSTQKEENET